MLEVLDLKSTIRNTISINSIVTDDILEIESPIVEEIHLKSLLTADVYTVRVK